MNIEVFSCSGGMARGFQLAGVNFDLVIDWSETAVESYARNIGHRPVRMDARDFLGLLQSGWRPRDRVRLIVMDPPCTPWSRAGKRLGEADERDMLAVAIGIVEQLKPDAYVIGNVPGLDDSTQWHVVQKHLARLAKLGYCVADYASLDAADYGVPQHRTRPFWFGHLAGPCIQWPSRTHGAPEECAPTLLGEALKPYVANERLPPPVITTKTGRTATESACGLARTQSC